MDAIDQVTLHFEPGSLVLLNIILGLIMFGVALELTPADFKRVVSNPKAAAVGLTTQLFLLPAVTFLMTLVVDLPASVELGMILVAACPGGNVSNFITGLAKGNASLSISMTAVVTTAAIIVTPFNISFWGGLNPETAVILKSVSIDAVRMVTIVATIIGLPVILAMTLRAKKEHIAAVLVKPFKVGSLLFLAVFIIIALSNNIGPAKDFLLSIAAVVVSHNLVALMLGYGVSSLFKLEEADKRAITVEVGIQNSGLGLVLIFTFFDGMGGMASVAAFWGMWHIIAGVSLARFFTRND